MGTENLFHKRRAKTERQLARKKQVRASYERVLIVCEGSKTEPYYFQELINCLELNSANVEVDGDSGSSPTSVVKHARNRYIEEKRTGDTFDKIYCVFDKDTHSTYEAALALVNNLKPKDVFKAINSVPCFEYWLLLHFEYTTKPFIGNGAKSSCENLIDDLKKYRPDYNKGNREVYSEVSKQTSQAIAFSKRSLSQAIAHRTDNPTTYIHDLVEYLQNLKK